MKITDAGVAVEHVEFMSCLYLLVMLSFIVQDFKEEVQELNEKRVDEREREFVHAYYLATGKDRAHYSKVRQWMNLFRVSVSNIYTFIRQINDRKYK